VNWIRMTQDNDQCWVFVSAVMNILVPYNARNFD